LAKRVLSWLIHAKRLLSTAELQHAVAVEPGQLELNDEFIPTNEIIGSLPSAQAWSQSILRAMSSD
jgi:hypothetical protein